MLIMIVGSLGTLASALLFIHLALVRPMKRFFVHEVVSSLTGIRDSIDRNTAAMTGFRQMPSSNGSSASITK